MDIPTLIAKVTSYEIIVANQQLLISSLLDLNDFINCNQNQVSHDVIPIVTDMILNQSNDKHLIISGPPNPAKHQLMTIIKDIQSSIRDQEIQVVDRHSLVQKYLSNESQNKTLLFSGACNKVLIEETYNSQATMSDDYSKEALDILNYYLSQ